ncbi:MAG: glycosyltransferase family 4 protein [Chloroflexi bacterium]|nr:glycosyltransferase family 4 protein [Chloroflexota bacterium]MBT4515054.1 glycosyltransferase family 4 protein [Chloroflexota bacterium]MBT6681423.1 glycosyltransferase family 4 protein [Chloroflexota bacterium]
MTQTFPGKVGLQQRVLPRYRAPFFERLSTYCDDGLDVFAGTPRSEEGIVVTDDLIGPRHVPANNFHFGNGGLYLCWQRGYKRWLKESDPDALIVSADPRIPSSYRATRYMHSLGKPVLGWGLGTLSKPTGRTKFSVVDRIRSRFYRSFDALIAYSSKAAEDYVRAGVERERIFVAHNAVSTASADRAVEKFPAGGEAVRKWRQDQRLSGTTLICVGRLVEAKRVDLLIDACRDAGQPCDLLIVGDGPERAALEAYAADSFPQTRFLGHLEGDDLSVALAASDLFVLPGAGGLAIYEAMAHGKPVLVGKGDGTESDLVQVGRNGELVEPDDLNLLTTAISAYLRDTERMRREGSESRQIAKSEISIDQMARTFTDALAYASDRAG